MAVTDGKKIDLINVEKMEIKKTFDNFKLDISSLNLR